MDKVHDHVCFRSYQWTNSMTTCALWHISLDGTSILKRKPFIFIDWKQQCNRELHFGFFFFHNFILFLNLQYCISFAKHGNESATGIPVLPILNPPPSSLLPSLWVVPVHQPQASSIVHRTWTGDSFHTWYYTCFNAILPNTSFFNFIVKIEILWFLKVICSYGSNFPMISIVFIDGFINGFIQLYLFTGWLTVFID